MSSPSRGTEEESSGRGPQAKSWTCEMEETEQTYLTATSCPLHQPHQSMFHPLLSSLTQKSQEKLGSCSEVCLKFMTLFQVRIFFYGKFT